MPKRVVLVTGGMGGLGEPICTGMADQGYTVVATYSPSNKTADAWVASMKEKGYDFHAVPCDVTDFDSAAAAVAKVTADVGAVDVLVNNAGITRDTLLLRMTDEQWDEVLNVNLRSIFIAVRASLRPMMRGKFGRIVNIGSVSGLSGNPGQANYAAAKAALVGFSKTVAKEMGAKGITVNVVAPGFIETDMTDVLGDAVKTAVLPNIPVRRFGKPGRSPPRSRTRRATRPASSPPRRSSSMAAWRARFGPAYPGDFCRKSTRRSRARTIDSVPV